jgi:hypothetical protein
VRYELIVFGADGHEPVEIYRVELPRGAQVWTPTIERCLKPGSRYAWALRAVVETADDLWSEATLFEIVHLPSDLKAAEQRPWIVQSIEPIEASGGTDHLRTAKGATAVAANPGRERLAPGATAEASVAAPITSALKVDGNLHVVTGDTPRLRFEQDDTDGYSPQTWDILANESTFAISDAESSLIRLHINRLSGLVSGAFSGDGTFLDNVTADDLACSNCLTGLTGSHVAPLSISADEIVNNSVGSGQIGPAAVRASEIASNAVGPSELATVRSVKVVCDGECDDVTTLAQVCSTSGGGTPVFVSCNRITDNFNVPPVSCGGDNTCLGFPVDPSHKLGAYCENLDTGSVSIYGGVDALVFCLTDGT